MGARHGDMAANHTDLQSGWVWSNLCICCPDMVKLVRSNLRTSFPLFHGGAGAAWAVSLTPFPPQSGDLSLASAKHNLSEHRNAVTTITSGPSTFHPAHFIKASYLSKRDNLHFFTSSEVIQGPAPQRGYIHEICCSI